MRNIFLSAIVMTAGLSSATYSQNLNNPVVRSAQEQLVGAWHLVRIESPDDKTPIGHAPLGMLIYTRDGHMSVQLMYPKSANAPSNEYVRDGYEASFGSYDVDRTAHTLIHHV